MIITLNRNGSGKDNDDIATIGTLKVGDFECVTLEDDFDTLKEWGKTRIPAGKYEIKFRNAGRLNEKYGRMFPDMHEGMLHIQDIPNYDYVYIHCGNKSADTMGCPLVGSKVENEDFISGSVVAYKKLYPIVASALKKEKVFINIID